MSISITPSLFLKAGAIGVAGFVAVDVARYVIGKRTVNAGGVPTGTFTGVVMGHKHTARAIFSEAAHPSRIVALARAGQEALAREKALFEPGASMANGARDAFRHTYWGALMTTRLVQDAGMNVEDAAAIAKKVGDAHEDDSRLTGPAYEHARHMDEHNNALGAKIGQRWLLEQGDTSKSLEDALQGRVLTAIRTGEALVIDAAGSAPRASIAADLSILRRAAQQLP